MIRIISILAATIYLLFSIPTYCGQQNPDSSIPNHNQLLRSEVREIQIAAEAKAAVFDNRYAHDNRAIVEGRKLFVGMNCVDCHASGIGGGMAPSLSDQEWIYGDKPEQIYLTILQGRPNGMPAFGNTLSEDSIWKLVAYIKTLATPVPADPPAQPGMTE